MELKFIEHKEAQDERGKYTRDEYRIGNYVVFRELYLERSCLRAVRQNRVSV